MYAGSSHASDNHSVNNADLTHVTAFLLEKKWFFKSRSIVVDYIGTHLAQIKDKSLSNMHSNWQLES